MSDSFVTELLASGYDIATIQKRLGHNSVVETTMVSLTSSTAVREYVARSKRSQDDSRMTYLQPRYWQGVTFLLVAAGMWFRLVWARYIALVLIWLLVFALMPMPFERYPDWLPNWLIIGRWVAAVVVALFSTHVLQVHRRQFRGYLPNIKLHWTRAKARASKLQR